MPQAPLAGLSHRTGGATSAWGLDQVDVVIAKAPDLIVLEFAINDADLGRGLSLAESRDNHRSLILQLHQGLRIPRKLGSWFDRQVH